MNIPAELKYSKDHEWVKIEGSTAIVGITHFAQEHLGDVVFIQLPDVGTRLAPSEPLGFVESVKAASDVFSPVSGTVTEINSDLVARPELVNQSPYGDGWMIKMNLDNVGDLESLLSASQYEAILSSEE